MCAALDEMGPFKVLTTFPQGSMLLAALNPGAVLLAASSGGPPLSNTVTSFSPQHVYLHCSTWSPSGPPSANAALPSHPLQSSYLLPPTSYLLFSVLSSFHHVLGCSSIPPTSSSDSLRALQCNARGLLATSAELLHYISLHPVDFICVENAILNWSSSFQIPGCSAI